MLINIPLTIWSFCLLFKRILSMPQLLHFARCLTQRIVYTPRRHTMSVLRHIFTKVPVSSNVSRFFKDSPINWKSIREKRLQIVAKYFRSRAGILSIDDVVCEKVGRKIADVGTYRSGMK